LSAFSPFVLPVEGEAQYQKGQCHDARSGYWSICARNNALIHGSFEKTEHGGAMAVMLGWWKVDLMLVDWRWLKR